MKILLLNQFFWPDSAATSQLLTDVAKQLSARSSVTVICGGTLYAQSSSGMAPRVRILRAPSFPFSRTAVGRVLSYLSFLAAAAWNGLRAEKPDAILTLTTPPGLPILGALLASLRGARHYIWEMDLYPEIATALGVFSDNSLVARTLRYALDTSRNRAAGVIALGRCMERRLVNRDTPSPNIHIVDNWADGRAICPAFFPNGPLTILYSGNLGLAHDVDTIREAMLRLRSDNRFQFVFSGGGSLRNELESFCLEHDVNGASFRPYCDVADLRSTLAQGHIGLVTQKPETLGYVVPSKTYGIMAAGRPILYIGPKAATPTCIIERHCCGWQIDPGDVHGLIDLLQLLERDRRVIYEAGARAREAFEQNYDLPIGVARICRILGLEVEIPAPPHVRAVTLFAKTHVAPIPDILGHALAPRLPVVADTSPDLRPPPEGSLRPQRQSLPVNGR